VRSRKVKIKLRIKDIAEKQGMTRAKLARSADLTYETVHEIWKNEYKDVSISTLAKIARVLHVNISELYTIEDNQL
jgi:DNA-binding XRE family transcriptional regulator